MKPGVEHLVGLCRDDLALDLLWFVPQDAEAKTSQRRFQLGHGPPWMKRPGALSLVRHRVL